MEQPTVGAQHEVVQVPVANAQDVHHDAIPRAALDERADDALVETKRAGGVRVMEHEVALDGLMLGQDLCKSRRLDELDQPIVGGGGEDLRNAQ